MGRKYIVCLSPVVKAMIASEAENAQIDWKAKQAIQQLMNEFPDCEEGAPVDYDEVEQAPQEKGKGKKKREPSEYQKFIGSCMRNAGIKSFSQAPQEMKKCVAQWHKIKKKKK